MNVQTMLAACLGMAVMTAAASAQNMFVGDWKLNPDKSHMTGDVIQFTSAADGGIKFTSYDRAYTFKTDGNTYKTSTDAESVWSKMDDNTYQEKLTRNGMDLGTTKWTISADGKKLTEESTGTNPDGKPFDDVDTYVRVAGTSGLMGSWKTTAVKMSDTRTMRWKAGSGDAISWEIPAIKATVDLTMDGKDCVPVGPTVPAGLTLSATKTGPHSFMLVEKLNGKVLLKASYKISADGKTLTEVSMPPDGKAPTTEIWEKQSM